MESKQTKKQVSDSDALRRGALHEIHMQREIVYRNAFKRQDQSFMKKTLSLLGERLQHGMPIEEVDVWALRTIIHNVFCSPAAVSAACGAKAKRGGPKNGAKALVAAMEVSKQIARLNNVEEAWAAAAATLNMSEGAVKRAWIEWKDELKERFFKPIMDRVDPERLQQNDEYLSRIFNRKSPGRPKKSDKSGVTHTE